RDKRIREKIRYTQRVIQQPGGSQPARGMEDDIGANLDALQRKIADAASAVGKQSKADSLARAADKTRDLVRGMESLDQRMRDRAQQARGQQGKGQQQGQQGQEGKGQQGQEGKGQQGQQGQSGQQGSEGQQGGQQGGSPNGG